MEQQEYSEGENSRDESFSTQKKKKRGNSKRFSDEQVKLLESMFSRGAKLEPRKKLQLATDIGLQPRQVSIWFQNKRARWKTKQLEQEYRALKTKFDALYEQFESLKKDNGALLDQLSTLRSLLENHQSNASEDPTIRDWANTDQEFKVKEGNEEAFCGDEDQKVVTKYFRQEDGAQLLTFSGQGSRSFLAPEQQQHNLVPGCLLDEPCCPSSWWD